MIVIIASMKQVFIIMSFILGMLHPVDSLAQDSVQVSYKTALETTSDVNNTQVNAFETGEWFKFRIHYGLLTAGYATLEVTDDVKNTSGYHIKGFGETTGLSRVFFKVEDYYESKIDKTSLLPYQFIRKIDEGGHTKNKVIDFDQDSRKAYVHDKKHNEEHIIETPGDVQDMVSAFYYLRNSVDTSNLKEGDETEVTMFFDEKNYPFKLRYLGKDVIRTKFGKINALKFRPLVLAGRVFKEQESLTVWVSNDENKIPLRIKASLAVGSIKADLEAFKGLKHSFKIIVE